MFEEDLLDRGVSSAAAPQSSGSRRLKYALIASLAVNLLVVGGVAGAMYTFGKHPPRFGYRSQRGFRIDGPHAPTFPKSDARRSGNNCATTATSCVPWSMTCAPPAVTQPTSWQPSLSIATPLKARSLSRDEKDRTLRQAAVTTFLGHAEQLTAEERSMLGRLVAQEKRAIQGAQSARRTRRPAPRRSDPGRGA